VPIRKKIILAPFLAFLHFLGGAVLSLEVHSGFQWIAFTSTPGLRVVLGVVAIQPV
jgi:hypothetical protein